MACAAFPIVLYLNADLLWFAPQRTTSHAQWQADFPTSVDKQLGSRPCEIHTVYV
jgi:hypothetical protein